MKPYVICIVGDECQKKELIFFLEKTARELEKKKIKTGMISKTSGFEDSFLKWRSFGEFNSEKMFLQFSIKKDFSLESLVNNFFYDLDLIFCLGFNHGNRMNISWISSSDTLKSEINSDVHAIISTQKINSTLPNFTLKEVDLFVKFLAEKSISFGVKTSPVRLLLNGKKLPLNKFVQKILINTIRGMVSSLRGGIKFKRLEIFIESDEI